MKFIKKLILTAIISLIAGFAFGYVNSYASTIPSEYVTAPTNEISNTVETIIFEQNSGYMGYKTQYILYSTAELQSYNPDGYNRLGSKAGVSTSFTACGYRRYYSGGWTGWTHLTMSPAHTWCGSSAPAYDTILYDEKTPLHQDGSYTIVTPADGEEYHSFPDIDVTVNSLGTDTQYSISIFTPTNSEATQWNCVQTFVADADIWTTSYHNDALNVTYPSYSKVKIEVNSEDGTLIDSNIFDIQILNTPFANFERITDGYEYACIPYFYVRKGNCDKVYLKVNGNIQKIITDDYTMIHTDDYQVNVGLNTFSLVDMNTAEIYDTTTVRITRDVPELEPIINIPTPTPLVPVPTGPPDETNMQQYIGNGLSQVIQLLTWPFNMVLQGLNQLTTTLTTTVTNFVGSYNAFMSLSGMIFGFLPVEWISVGTLGIGLSMFLWFVGRK